MGDLLPCPFCGSMPRMRPFAEPFKGVAVTCQTPNCPASPISTGAALADPHVNVNAWNRRAIPAADARAEALLKRAAQMAYEVWDDPEALANAILALIPDTKP